MVPVLEDWEAAENGARLMPPTFALIMIGVFAVPAFAAGIVVGALGAFVYFYRRELLALIKRDRSSS
jgi:hypothetical protein